MITPQVSGAVLRVDIVEGQRVGVGDKLFEIDPAPYRAALALAEGRLAAAKAEYENLQLSYKSDQIRSGWRRRRSRSGSPISTARAHC